MIVTEPLPRPVWDEIGWAGAELLGDHAHAYCYAQRTADGRIALGGRGIPYRFGSRTDDDGRTQDWTIASLTGDPARLFPATARGARSTTPGAACSGVPRDWCASVALRPRRPASAGPAATSAAGSTTTNLAGRTLRRPGRSARDTELTRLCPGSTGRYAAGSPNRCAGSACARCTGCTAQADRPRGTTVCAGPVAWPGSGTAHRPLTLGTREAGFVRHRSGQTQLFQSPGEPREGVKSGPHDRGAPRRGR